MKCKKYSDQVLVSCFSAQLVGKRYFLLFVDFVLLHHISTGEEEAERKTLLIILLESRLLLTTNIQLGQRIHTGQEEIRSIPSRAPAVSKLPVYNHHLALSGFFFEQKVVEMKVSMLKTLN